MRIAFLTMDSLEGFVSDDQLAIDTLKKRGWQVETVAWRSKRDWSSYDLVVIRTPWDYQQAPEEFMRVLEDIDRATRLENPIEVVRWNLRKTYLRDLEQRGIQIVETYWGAEPMTLDLLKECQDRFGSEEVIVKPVVSANADFTYRLRPEQFDSALSELQQVFAAREYMIQPFLRTVVEEGEYSVFYFGGEYSHTILKTPKNRDFRVQEEHGGLIKGVAAEATLLDAANLILQALKQQLLYCRADLVRDERGGFSLMELELIEPSLYFRTHPAAAENFARALERWIT